MRHQIILFVRSQSWEMLFPPHNLCHYDPIYSHDKANCLCISQVGYIVMVTIVISHITMLVQYMTHIHCWWKWTNSLRYSTLTLLRLNHSLHGSYSFYETEWTSHRKNGYWLWQVFYVCDSSRLRALVCSSKSGGPFSCRRWCKDPN